MATNWKERWCFLIGFAENERDNIEPAELIAMQELAEILLRISDEDLAKDYREIDHEGESQG